MRFIIGAILAIAFTSCGKQVEYVVKPASVESYSYELTERGCSTGEHAFETLKQTCEALLNEELNNNCAKEDRDSLFANHNCVQIF